MAGWLAALAAGLLVGYLVGARPAAPLPGPSAGVRLAQLVESTPALTKAAWQATGDAAGPEATGEVFWSDAKQEGYMTFSGLAANDPAVEQYQLWVFDSERDTDHPVDGGVFDIPPAVERVVTPIDVKIAVTKATMFAITVEKSGGVVVSDRSRLPLLAKVE